MIGPLKSDRIIKYLLDYLLLGIKEGQRVIFSIDLCIGQTHTDEVRIRKAHRITPSATASAGLCEDHSQNDEARAAGDPCAGDGDESHTNND